MYIYLYIFYNLQSLCSQYGPIFVVYRHAAASSVLNITNEWLISQDEDLVSFMVKIPHDIIKFNILVNSSILLCAHSSARLCIIIYETPLISR